MKLDTFKPLRNLVLVHIEEVKVGGLILPNTDAVPYNEATVIKVGTGSYLADGKLLPMPVKEGDKVMIPSVIKKGVLPIKFDGDDKEYHLIADKDIQAVIS
jgi:chaperonin GroES